MLLRWLPRVALWNHLIFSCFQPDISLSIASEGQPLNTEVVSVELVGSWPGLIIMQLTHPIDHSSIRVDVSVLGHQVESEESKPTPVSVSVQLQASSRQLLCSDKAATDALRLSLSLPLLLHFIVSTAGQNKS
jgi:hypothetical protein